MLIIIIFNWITIQSIILHSILFSYGSVHICGNSNKLSRVTSQSKVENKMAPYRTAAMIFTAILDLEARRKVKEAFKATKRKICHLKQQQRIWESFWLPLAIPRLILSHMSFLLCMMFNSCRTTSSLHNWSDQKFGFLKPPCACHFVQSRTVIIRDCNQLMWTHFTFNSIIIRS